MAPPSGAFILFLLMDNYELYQVLRPRYICLCFGLTEEDLKNAIFKHNIQTFDELQKQTKCSSNCGTCEGDVKKILNNTLAETKKSID